MFMPLKKRLKNTDIKMFIEKKFLLSNFYEICIKIKKLN